MAKENPLLHNVRYKALFQFVFDAHMRFYAVCAAAAFVYYAIKGPPPNGVAIELPFTSHPLKSTPGWPWVGDGPSHVLPALISALVYLCTGIYRGLCAGAIVAAGVWIARRFSKARRTGLSAGAR